jgi:hypothetical protein
MTTTRSEEDDQTRPQSWVRLRRDTVAATIDLLNDLDAFWREHADDAAHAQLRAFCAAVGAHPSCGAPALLDELGLRALTLQAALQGTSAADDCGTRS